MSGTRPEGLTAIDPQPRASAKNYGWWPLVAVLLAVFMLMLDSTVVSVALPGMQKDLHANLTDLQWVMNAYIVTLAAVQLTAGSVADRLGSKPLFVTGVAVFTLSSLACGLSPTATVLITARIVQGLAGAMMFTTSLALIGQCYEGRKRGMAFGFRGTVAGLAVVLGPMVGGALVAGLGWRWIFFLNLPIGVFALIVALRQLPKRADRHAGRIDLPGPILFAAAMVALNVILLKGNDLGWPSKPILITAAVAVIAFVMFLVVEAKRRDPMLPLSMFRKGKFTGTQIAAFSVQASIFALFVYLSLYFQDDLGYTALQAGLCYLPVVVPILFTAPLAGALMDKIKREWLVTGGLILLGVGLLLLQGLSTASNWVHLVAGLAVSGVACGITLPSIGSLAVDVDEPRQIGIASGVNNTVVQLGLAVGIGGFGAIFGRYATASAGHAGFVHGLDELFTVAAIVAFAGAVLSALLIRTRSVQPVSSADD